MLVAEGREVTDIVTHNHYSFRLRKMEMFQPLCTTKSVSPGVTGTLEISCGDLLRTQRSWMNAA